MLTLTRRALRMIQLAEQQLPQSREVLVSEDLFMGGLLDGTGVLGELFLRGKFDLGLLQQHLNGVSHGFETESTHPFFRKWVSPSVVEVMNRAEALARHYQQLMLNEGHIYTAILERDEVRQLLKYAQTGITTEEVLAIVASTRDMTVHLDGRFNTSESSQVGQVVIRRAQSTDHEAVVSYVQAQFGERWVASVQHAFKRHSAPMFIAQLDGEFTGFACYDVAHGKRGVFGPMGTSLNHRQAGVGKALLWHCLSAMQRVGYDYAIIKAAGPIEFYERACGAATIPLGVFNCESGLGGEDG